jgi:hypothetical protein
MSKPHLIIIGGRVHSFQDRQGGRAMRLRILRRVVSHTRNHTFGDWFRSKRKFEALRVKPEGPQNEPIPSLTHRMLEAWRTRGPLFGRKGERHEKASSI